MIKFNSKVKLHYSISSIDDLVFESTFDKDPVEHNYRQWNNTPKIRNDPLWIIR
jgi:hypothetical protein